MNASDLIFAQSRKIGRDEYVPLPEVSVFNIYIYIYIYESLLECLYMKHLIRMVHIVGAHFHWDTYTNLSKSSHLQELSVNTESQVHLTSLLGMGYKCGEMLRCDR